MPWPGLKTQRVSEEIDQLLLLTKLTWDGDLVSKAARDKLVKAGYVHQFNGWNLITAQGVDVLTKLGLLWV